MFGKLTKFHIRLKKLRMEKTRKRISKKILTAEEELASKLQMVEAEILPLRWGYLSLVLGNTSYREGAIGCTADCGRSKAGKVCSLPRGSCSP